MIDAVTPLVITLNEAPNLCRTLDQLRWARRVVVLDSGSTDDTLAIAGTYPNVEVFHRPFDTFADQCGYGLGLVDTEWVLSLDADHVLGPGSAEEILGLTPADEVTAYRVRFTYLQDGRPLRATLYPPRVVLFRRRRGRFVNDGHAHRVEVEGTVGDLQCPFFHDDRKPLDRWLRSQARYALDEARKLATIPPGRLPLADRLRRTGWAAPLIIPFYCLFARGLVLDGRVGLFYTLQRTYAEVLLALHVLGRRLSPPDPTNDAG